MQIFNEQIDKAISFAVKAHKDQFRKTDPSLPYIYHPISVGFILSLAGILHDVIEDCGVSSEELKVAFGHNVTELVKAVSENKQDSWEKRKQDYLDRVIKSPSEVKAMAVADKLHNVYSLINAIKIGGNIDGVFRKDKNTSINYYVNFSKFLSESWSHPLVEELKVAVLKLKAGDL